MGVIHFQTSGNATAEVADVLRRAYLAGDYDRSPIATRVELTDSRLTLRREQDQSSFASIPWEIAGAGLLMGNTSTLMERPAPYRLLLELARGKVNQLRSQAEDWRLGGLEIHPVVDEQIHIATKTFGKAVLEADVRESEQQSLNALAEAYGTAEALISQYSEQLFAYRRQASRNDSVLACRLTEVPSAALDDAFRQTFNTAGIPLNWRVTEPGEANYNWEKTDRLLNWALERNLGVAAGPLIDFSAYGLPNWLQTWEGDLPSLASFMCDYIETTVNRYSDRIRRWVICTGSNCANSLRLSEDDLIRLTARLAEAAWGIDSNLEVAIGLAKPWGEYLASGNFNYSPFVFADTLLRAGLPLAGFEIEWHMGTSPSGSFCRDPLEASRLLDMFGMLGCPLQLSLSYPSSADRDPLADPEQMVGKTGWWHGITPLAQAEWAEAFTTLALAKGNVSGVHWAHYCDADPHRMPNGGLVDAAGNKKPSLDRLRILRETCLRDPDETRLA
jgi:hypothetical protein